MARIPTVEESLAEPNKPEVGRSAKMRNLQWIIGGVVATLAAVGIFTSTGNREVEDQQKVADKDRLERLKQSQISTPVHQDEIDRVISDQKAIPGETQREQNTIPGSLAGTTNAPKAFGMPGQSEKPLVPPLPGVPDASKPYPGTTPPLPNDTELKAKEASDLVKRDEQIRAAQILAISDSGAAARNQQSPTGQAPVGSGTMAPQNGSPIASWNNQLEDAKARLTKAQGGGTQEEMLRNYQSTQGVATVGRPTTGAYGVGNQTADANSRWLDSQGKSSNSRTLTAERPASQYIVGQGAFIPATLITEINSDMPGQLTAVVSMDVFDSIQGDQLMIPKGSRLVGVYNNDVRAGQERVLAAFQRLVFPNGSSVDLMGMSSSDAQGRAGMPGDVNNHFFKMFSASFLTAGLAQLFQKGSSNTVVVSGTAGNPGITAAGQILVDVSKAINERNTRISPTITIKQGHKFNVIVNKDMSLSPYRQ